MGAIQIEINALYEFGIEYYLGKKNITDIKTDKINNYNNKKKIVIKIIVDSTFFTFCIIVTIIIMVLTAVIINTFTIVIWHRILPWKEKTTNPSSG